MLGHFRFRRGHQHFSRHAQVNNPLPAAWVLAGFKIKDDMLAHTLHPFHLRPFQRDADFSGSGLERLGLAAHPDRFNAVANPALGERWQWFRLRVVPASPFA